MSGRADHSPPPDTQLGAGLLIVTGASHTGKSSVIQSLVPLLAPPIAVLAVDDILQRTLVRPLADPWNEIPLSYELIRCQADVLLARGWFVVLESTFTYVPSSGAPELHEDALRQMISLAERRGTPWILCQLNVAPESASRRGEQSQRLAPNVIAQTVRLHEELDLPTGTLQLSTTDDLPEVVARTLLNRLPASFKRR